MYAATVPRNGYATHRWDKYPAKMIPEMARFAIERVSDAGDLVVDPFCGCGTVQVEGSLLGRPTLGIDVNPIAVLLARAKSARFDAGRLRRHATEAIEGARRNRHAEAPPSCWVDYWFTRATLGKLRALASTIESRERISVKYRDLLRACLAVAVRRCSRADPRSPKPFISARARSTRVGRHFDPFAHFVEVVEELCVAGGDLQKRMASPPGTVTIQGDARHMDVYVDPSVDAFVTSPPYLSAQDYFRSTKLELAILGSISGDEVRLLGSRILGSGRGRRPRVDWDCVGWCPAAVSRLSSKDPRAAADVNSYLVGIRDVLRGMHALLRPGGMVCMVVGNSTLRGESLSVHRWVVRIGSAVGFSLFDHVVDRIRDRRIPPSRSHGTIIENEHLLFFKKGT